MVYGASAVAGTSTVAAGYLLFFPAFVFHIFIAAGLIVAAAVPAFILLWEQRRKSQIDDMLPRFLEDVADSQEAGLTLLKAFEESSKRSYGPITTELKLLVAQITWGVEFEAAFLSFAKRLDTELTTKVTALLLEAMRLGGDLKTTFQSTASFVREMIQLRKEKESQLRPYVMVIYVSVVVFMLIIIILYQSFFLSMMTGGSGEAFLKLPMSIEGYKALLFDLVVIEAFFGGITVGKLSGGRAATGLKHSVVLLTLATAIFGLFFLDPISPTITAVQFDPLTPTSERPVMVTAEVKDPFPGSGVQTAFLVWTDDNWKTEREVEMDYNRVKELWEAQIPPRPGGTKVFCLVRAVDNSRNEAVNDNGGLFFGYQVIE